MTDLSLPKPLAAVLKTCFARVEDAREAVEHRIASIPRQEKVVAEWVNDTAGKAGRDYPGHALDSYPVQTRMRREISQLERYRAELPERLREFAQALNAMESTSAEVDRMAEMGAFKGPTEPRPMPGAALAKRAWPKTWPMTRAEAQALTAVRDRLPSVDRAVALSARQPDFTEFVLSIGTHRLSMSARHSDGIETFKSELEDVTEGASSTRWRAILEAIRCDIRWPQLEAHLAKPSPWLPTEFVGEEFGLRGSLLKREALSDLLVQLSPEAAHWYLAQMPGRASSEDLLMLGRKWGELVAARLVRVGEMLGIEEMLSGVPFAQVKSLFILAGLKPPTSFALAVSRFAEVRAIRTEAFLRAWLEEFFDPMGFVVVDEAPGIEREERLGPRARANVMVSSIVILAEGDPGALAIFE